VRAIIGILVGIGLIVLILVLVFTGGSSNNSPKQPLYMPNYWNSGSYAEITQTGPINAPQSHQELTMSVSETDSTLSILNGYENNVVSTNNFPMDPTAYTDFLFALQRLDFTSGNNSSSLSDSRGYCPFGDLYTFSFNNGTNQVENYWENTCGQGNFEGQAGPIKDLFIAEIPNYDNLTSGLTNL
jgi:hypothetical protein